MYIVPHYTAVLIASGGTGATVVETPSMFAKSAAAGITQTNRQTNERKHDYCRLLSFIEQLSDAQINRIEYR